MSGPAIVLLGGFLCDGRLYAAQETGLRRAGFGVRVGDITGAASIEALAQHVLAEAPEQFALAGLSMGGIVAFEILRQAPERITHLALMNTTPLADAAGAVRLRQLQQVADGELDRVLREELKPRYFAPDHRTPERLALLGAMGRGLGAEVFVRQTLALMSRASSEDLLPRIACPTLVLCGDRDSVCPVSLHSRMAQAIPGAELVIVENCGHISPLEQPDCVTQALIRLLARPAAMQAQRQPV